MTPTKSKFNPLFAFVILLLIVFVLQALVTSYPWIEYVIFALITGVVGYIAYDVFFTDEDSD